jgi:hypothetical protein
MNGRGHIHGHPSGPESPLNNEFLSRIKEMYGTFDEPNFSFVMEAIRSRPYEDVISEVVTTLGLAFEEYNDPNDDASFQYQLSRGSESWAVELSMLGPFAVVARIGDGWDRILELKMIQTSQKWSIKFSRYCILMAYSHSARKS